ncbi:MAG: methyltransferase [Opitutia bacterium]
MKADNELYRRLRSKDCSLLWAEDVAGLAKLAEPERSRRAAVVRAVGVAFAERGTEEQKSEARAWIRGLLSDPSEKIRRYAAAALPKLGDDRAAEEGLLGRLESAEGERERKALAEALRKVGGQATLESPLARSLPLPESALRARAARSVGLGHVRLDGVLREPAGQRVRFRCRAGLERLLAEEIAETLRDRMSVSGRGEGWVEASPSGPIAFADLLEVRLWSDLAFPLGEVRARSESAAIVPLAQAIASPRCRAILDAFGEGVPRYRIDLDPSLGDAELLQAIASEAYRLNSSLLNDAREAPWSVDILSIDGGAKVELRPRLVPDPRFAHRLGDVPAASHPPLAAALARLAGPFAGEVAWDPFCGSAQELVERARLGGVDAVIGTDLDARAVEVARRNFAAAKLSGPRSAFVAADFRQFARVPGLARGGVTLVISNPPMGRRVRIDDLGGLYRDFLSVAAEVLRPGGRLVMVNPVKVEKPDARLRLVSSEPVDLGGFTCNLERWDRI